MEKTKIIPLKEKMKLKDFRSEEWFDENIWEDDLDTNEVVELILNEVSKDTKTSLQNLKSELEGESFSIDYQRGTVVFLSDINKAFKKHIGELE